MALVVPAGNGLEKPKTIYGKTGFYLPCSLSFTGCQPTSSLYRKFAAMDNLYAFFT